MREKSLRLRGALFASLLALTGCGAGKVLYTLACTAQCPATGGSSAVSLTACSQDGQDPNQIAQQNVNACVSAAQDGGCPNPTCACQATRTTTPCT
jgi:hypothetical protein